MTTSSFGRTGCHKSSGSPRLITPTKTRPNSASKNRQKETIHSPREVEQANNSDEEVNNNQMMTMMMMKQKRTIKHCHCLRRARSAVSKMRPPRVRGELMMAIIMTLAVAGRLVSCLNRSMEAERANSKQNIVIQTANSTGNYLGLVSVLSMIDQFFPHFSSLHFTSLHFKHTCTSTHCLYPSSSSSFLQSE